jgi:hypothetical protein
MDYEYISGELFSKIADVSIYDRNYLNQFPNIKYNCNKIIYNNEPINKDSLSIINNSNIFFVKTDHLNFFISYILPFISNKFILITHNSDLSSGNNKIIYNNKFLIKWYGQNMIPNYDIDKLIGIPIGLENSQWKGSDYNICKKYKNNIKENLLYFNFSLNTNKERGCIENHLLKQGFSKNSNKDWEYYIKELSTYKFAISPEGNGIDCHRVWECIYVGCIPILKNNNIMYDFFKDLPILWVNNFSSVTETSLLEQYKILKNIKFNIEKSTLKYWYNHIRNLHI